MVRPQASHVKPGRRAAAGRHYPQTVQILLCHYLMKFREKQFVLATLLHFLQTLTFRLSTSRMYPCLFFIIIMMDTSLRNSLIVYLPLWLGFTILEGLLLPTSTVCVFLFALLKLCVE